MLLSHKLFKLSQLFVKYSYGFSVSSFDIMKMFSYYIEGANTRYNTLVTFLRWHGASPVFGRLRRWVLAPASDPDSAIRILVDKYWHI